jgi:hypothetical protein
VEAAQTISRLVEYLRESWTMLVGNINEPVKPLVVSKAISELVGDALLGIAANRQVCAINSEITFGNQSNSPNPFFFRLFEVFGGVQFLFLG